ncbi:hypothetical protein pdam_00021950 [Pocillopora damicornis]|uniref:Uncharacterized protein n=1 Tax=Pocillopora damicornis TaxID=46731 RepID=A0A3M6UWC9_POCDA|nr:hypothetical protein pdam_00021950 [Pocillopora damicornis]
MMNGLCSRPKPAMYLPLCFGQKYICNDPEVGQRSKSAFEEKLTIERIEKWTQHSHNEQVFGKHFVLGKPFPYWHKHNVGWVPNLGLRKKTSECKIYYELKAKRKERAKIRETRLRATVTWIGRAVSEAN